MGDVRLIDEVRSLIGDALNSVRGDFSRTHARDAAANAVMPKLEGLLVRPDDVVVVLLGAPEQTVVRGADIAVVRPVTEEELLVVRGADATVVRPGDAP